MSPRELHLTNDRTRMIAFFSLAFVPPAERSLTPATAGSPQFPRLTRVADLSLATVRP